MGATAPGPNGKPWVETEEDRLCADCGEPKHTHIGGTGTSTENPKCAGFKAPTAPLVTAPA